MNPVTKYNRKTVTVVTDDHHQRNVAPVFLSRVAPKTMLGTTPRRTDIALGGGLVDCWRWCKSASIRW